MASSSRFPTIGVDRLQLVGGLIEELLGFFMPARGEQHVSQGFTVRCQDHVDGGRLYAIEQRLVVCNRLAIIRLGLRGMTELLERRRVAPSSEPVP